MHRPGQEKGEPFMSGTEVYREQITEEKCYLKSAFRSDDYDRKIAQTLPFYELYYEQVIELVKILKHNAVRWLDIGSALVWYNE